MLSVIIPWHNRIELKQSLPSIVSYCKNINGEILVVNLGGKEDLLNDQIGVYKDSIIRLNIGNTEGFNKPVAQNIGANYAKYSYLFFCDCDILFKVDVISTLLNMVANKEDSFGTLEGVKETVTNSRNAGNLEVFGYNLKLRIKDGTEVNIVDNEEDAKNGMRQAPGLLLVSKKNFKKVQGYNSSLDGWGWEDQDMICRLTLYAKLKRIQFGKAWHISHDDQSRTMGYPKYHDRWQSRDAMFRRALDNYDRNNFLGTCDKDLTNYIDKIEVIDESRYPINR